jgi:putative oxidoreductase
VDIASRVRLPPLLLRIGVFIVRLMWTLDKFVQPGHSAGVFKKFYQLDIGGPAVGAVLLLHGVSTVSSYRQYLAAFDNLLFFAAWPMLAACVTLYLLRDLDTYTFASFTRRSSSS